MSTKKKVEETTEEITEVEETIKEETITCPFCKKEQPALNKRCIKCARML